MPKLMQITKICYNKFKNGKIVYDFTEDSILVDNDNIFTISNVNSNNKKLICVSKNKIAYETDENIDLSYYDIENKILQIYNSSKDYSDRYSYYDLKNKPHYQKNL